MTNATFIKNDVIASRRRINLAKHALDCFVVTLLAMTPLAAHSAAVRGDGHLNLYYDARHEHLDITYRNARGDIIPSALEKINVFLRSPDNHTHAVDMQLLDMVDAIQDHFHEPVIEIISGYRSPDYNKSLKETGHAVANESLHMQGKAIDIHLDTVTEEAVRDYATSLGLGGVGWYPQNDFVHVDLGEVRSWGHKETTRKFVGLSNNTGPLMIRTDANRYFKTDDIRVSVTPNPEKKPWRLEKFDRGTWVPIIIGARKTLSDADFRIQQATTDKLPRGRYRIRISESFSNEFYLKN